MYRLLVMSFSCGTVGIAADAVVALVVGYRLLQAHVVDTVCEMSRSIPSRRRVMLCCNRPHQLDRRGAGGGLKDAAAESCCACMISRTLPVQAAPASLLPSASLHPSSSHPPIHASRRRGGGGEGSGSAWMKWIILACCAITHSGQFKFNRVNLPAPIPFNHTSRERDREGEKAAGTNKKRIVICSSNSSLSGIARRAIRDRLELEETGRPVATSAGISRTPNF